MNSHDRFRATMEHRTPDRPPIDIGGTSLTGIRKGCLLRLRELLGFSSDPEPANSREDEQVLQWTGSDFRSVGGIVRLPSPHTKRISDTEHIDAFGVRRAFSHGDWQITHSPLKEADIKDLDSYIWPEARVDETTLSEWEARAKALKDDGRYVVVGEHPVFGVLELACWMCGYDVFMMKMAEDPGFVHAFFEKVLALQLRVIEQYYAVLGPYIDLTMSGDDFGTQLGPMVSPKMFAEFVAPPFKERIKRTKEIGKCHYWHHSCGAIVPLLEQLIDCGVEILNPVQTSARGMDPKSLKERFGDRLVFWGAVDVQQLLPHATPEGTARAVTELVEVLGKDGGYVVAPAHEVQDDVPAENIVAWVETLKSISASS